LPRREVFSSDLYAQTAFSRILFNFARKIHQTQKRDGIAAVPLLELISTNLEVVFLRVRLKAE
jgi:hypothetical protein